MGELRHGIGEPRRRVAQHIGQCEWIWPDAQKRPLLQQFATEKPMKDSGPIDTL